MSLHRTKATIIGLLEASRVNEWIVTEKLGDALKGKASGKGLKRFRFRIGDRYKISRILLHSVSNISKKVYRFPRYTILFIFETE
jgi:beta-mannan synthase